MRFTLLSVLSLSWLMSAPCLAQDQTAAKTADADEAAVKELQFAQIELKGAMPEGAMSPGLFSETVETLDGILSRLKKAADDEKIHGVVLQVSGPSLGWGKVYEVRRAIAKVREKGKPVIAYLESGMTSGYLLAAACDQVILPESGMLMLPGLRAEVTFYKKLFDWLEIEPQMLRVGEYKSAAEPYSRSEMSKEFREEMEAVLDDFYQQIVAMIAESRKLPADKVRQIIDTALISAADAKALGLIDHVGYEESIATLAKGKTPDAEFKLAKGYGKKRLDADFSGINGMITMMNLLMGVDKPQRKTTNPKLAVISAIGPIMSGPSRSDLFGDSTMGSTTMVKAIRQARDDATVKAIVLRVDSPGGSALASDLIWHELQTVKKPVVVSMGDVAASGGYYIAMGAERIFAEPGTITGSIGVVGGKLATEKFFAKLGMTTSIVKRGENSGVLSMTTPFSDSERTAMQKMLNDIYGQFTTKAAAGRKMDVEKLEKLARGRIYSGTKAKELGLIDEIGTLDDAIAYAKQAAGIPATDKLERLNLPKAVSPFEQLLGPLEPETSIGATALSQLWQRLPTELVAPLRNLAAFEMLAREPVLTVLPFQLTIR